MIFAPLGRHRDDVYDAVLIASGFGGARAAHALVEAGQEVPYAPLPGGEP